MRNRATTHKEYGIGARLLGGAVAGMIAGAAMAMVAMIRAAAIGLEFWLPPKQIAALIYGVDALIQGGSAAVVGLVIHMVVSGAAGMMFGLLAYRWSAAAALGAGLIYGILLWAVMTWIVMPIANQVMLERVMVMPTWWFAYHLVFGAMLILTPALVSSFARRDRTAPAAATSEGRVRKPPAEHNPA